MTQYDFDLLLKRYLSGECTEEEEKIVEQWSAELLNQTKVSINPDEKETIKKRIWKSIHKNGLRKASKTPFVTLTSLFRYVAIAASVVVMLSVGFLLYQNPKAFSFENIASAAPPPKGVIEITNTSSKAQEIKLEDGSIVLLKEKSSLRYPEHFGNKNRDIYLTGEGFFKVKRDPSKPFIVHTGDIITEVLGTSFNVKSYDDASSVEVSVVSGRVSVYEKDEKPDAPLQKNLNGVILTPNQKIVFEKATRKMISTIIEKPIVIHPPQIRTLFIFEETSLPHVLDKLTEAYGIEIVMQNPAMSKCTFTGDLNDLSLYKQLDLICRSVNSTYEQRGTGIFINGDGCN